ncbi:MAG: hypothetical protein OEW64_13250 [Gammaproteobacteria bacterium]|nr:hypothetical protein [Gammaproteobacteria bacterium]MDH5305049.1 hypothetical protein [Gammaproteobacteria bacterium]MDH5322839.1 hypothetical protein [Gammaproteobacteria bacterium]
MRNMICPTVLYVAGRGKPVNGVNWDRNLDHGRSMPANRYYDTVAFDVRDNTTMLFFAQTTSGGDIDDYLLLMRTIEEDFNESMYIEVNDRQFGGHDLISESVLLGNTLTLKLHAAAAELDGATQITITFADTPENGRSIECGAFRVLGDTLSGGNA